MTTKISYRHNVTVGIIVHNSISYLKLTLKSLRKNTDIPYQLIIVNDSGMVMDYRAIIPDFDALIIQNGQRMGYGYCANLIIEQTQTPYIVLLESDTYVTSGWLSGLLSCLASNERYACSGPSTSFGWGEQRVIDRPDWKSDQIERYGQEVAGHYKNVTKILNAQYDLSGFCYALKKEAIDKIGHFDTSYKIGDYADLDYNIRVAQAGYDCVWVCGSYVHHFGEKYLTDSQFAQYQKRNRWIYNQRLNAFLKDRDNSVGENASPAGPVRIKTSDHSKKPLVSCIMPTYNRRRFASQAIKYFLRQDYPHKELIIVDDGREGLADLIKASNSIRYIRLNQRVTLGRKRNICIEQCSGDIILHWDDDDWYLDHRISYQTEKLMGSKTSACGLVPGIFYDVDTGEAWSSAIQLHDKMFYFGIMGGSICYWRELWEGNIKFSESSSLAEEVDFLKKLRKRGEIIKLDNNNSYIYVRHETNTWKFILGEFIDPCAWKKVKSNGLLPEEDLAFYKSLRKRGCNL